MKWKFIYDRRRRKELKNMVWGILEESVVMVFYRVDCKGLVWDSFIFFYFYRKGKWVIG